MWKFNKEKVNPIIPKINVNGWVSNGVKLKLTNGNREESKNASGKLVLK